MDALVFLHDNRLASGAQGTVKLWNTDTGKEVATLLRHSGPREAMKPIQDGKALAVFSYAGFIRLWDAETRKELTTLKGFDQREIASLALSPDGKLMAIGSGKPDGSGELTLWDVKMRKQLRSLPVGKGWLNALRFSPDGKTLASAAVQTTQKKVEPPTPPPPGGGFGIPLALTYRSQVQLWDVGTGEQRAGLLKDEPVEVTCLAFGPGGKTLAVGSDASVQLWELRDRPEKVRLKTVGIPPETPKQ